MSEPAPSHFERMLGLIEETFSYRNDPSQLQVDEEVIEKLQAIHPATLSEYNEGQGPAVWILLIPTTTAVMEDFLARRINEQEVLDRTHPGETYEAIYLCSATVLPEYRNKGLAKKMCLDAIERIRTQHPITQLFVWPFTPEGKALAEKIAAQTGLTLRSLD